MKTFYFRLFLIVFAVLSYSFAAQAQVPAGFNYQAIARDADGNAIAKSTLSVRIGILTIIDPTQRCL